MSSLHKFHRRTASSGPAPTWPPTAIGGGDEAHGYWLGAPGNGTGTTRLIVAPKSTEAQKSWGSESTRRYTTSSSTGLANTNTLAAFGASAHPAAHYAKNITTGGYNTWYLPAYSESNTCFNNRASTPFATSNGFTPGVYWVSTEYDADTAYCQTINMPYYNGSFDHPLKRNTYHVRAVRQTTVF